MNISSFASSQPYNYPTIGCDLPQNGGIGGNLGKPDKPIPGACEERPRMIDPKTGELVYVDVYEKQHRPNVVFSTTA